MRDEPSTLAGGLLVAALLYLFLVGIALLETGIESLGGGFQQALLATVANPVAGLFAGVLATVLVQSSSVSTSTIVGLVGAGTLTVPFAVPMIMGANIGTTVTNTLAALGNLRRSDEFRRAFAGATVHDFFNLLTVAVMLPLELSTGWLSGAADALATAVAATGIAGGEGTSPIKAAVGAPADALANFLGGLGTSPVFDGSLMLAAGLATISVALAFITHNMRALVAGRIERGMNRFIGRGGGAAGIVLGLVVTMAVQSSSITTSILVPMVAAGVLTLPNAYPITLGANIGTTITALLASLAVDLRAGLVIALVHTLFNVFGIAVWYPLPALRHVPIRLATGLADVAMRRRWLALVYTFGVFVLLPLVGILLLR